MTLKLNGTNSEAAPAYAGDDADTGLQCGTNELKLVTGGTARATVDSSGRLLVGASSASTLRTNIVPKIQTEATVATENGISLFTNVNSSSGPFLIFGKSRGTTAGSNTVVQNNDDLATLLFIGADGTDRASSGASIAAAVDGTPGSNDMPGRLVFSTTADGASSPTERLRITSDGTIRLASGCPGIDFSQIQTNASGMSSETLDSYEEGTWTPTSGTNFGTFTGAGGGYTKIGRLVMITYSFTTTISDISSNARIEGLPFTVSDTVPGTSVEAGAVCFSDSRLYFTMPLGNSTDMVVEVDRPIQGSASASSQFYRGSAMYMST